MLVKERELKQQELVNEQEDLEILLKKVANTNMPIHYYGGHHRYGMHCGMFYGAYLAYAAGQLQIDSEILMLCSYGCS